MMDPPPVVRPLTAMLISIAHSGLHSDIVSSSENSSRPRLDGFAGTSLFGVVVNGCICMQSCFDDMLSFANAWLARKKSRQADHKWLPLLTSSTLRRMWICSDYIGCMKNGEIYTSDKYRWYEPQHQLLGGGQYFTHAWGPVYVLSWRIAREVSQLNPNSLRFFNNEGGRPLISNFPTHTRTHAHTCVCFATP